MAVEKGKLKNRIAGVGIELEGAWVQQPKFGVIRDGSVDIRVAVPKKFTKQPYDLTDADRRKLAAELNEWKRDFEPKYVGEIPSPRLEMDGVQNFMRENYPKYVNASCGLHVHMSFQYLINYNRLMTPDFTPFMVKGLLNWAEEEKLAKDHPLWPRLQKPDHNHCAHIYLGEGQSKITRKEFSSRGTSHSRYTAINYCFAQHRTVECRLLSMMDEWEQGYRAVSEVLNITNRFLSKQRSKELKLQGRVPRTGIITQERRVYV